ncbi:DNA primase [bacterium BMS3Bbin14]|nr:DNA primase [bacterium BMS3Bbin14]
MPVTPLREEIKNRIREAADIVQVIGECVELKRSGARFTGRCPFHAEKTPSFSVNPQGRFFHCFGCGESGDVFSFVMKYYRLSFPEALKELARRCHIDLPESRLSEADRQRIKERDMLYRVNEQAAALYQRYLLESPKAEEARAYLERRGVPAAAIKDFRLGYAPDPGAAGWSFATSHLQGLRLPVTVIEKAGLAVKKEHGGYYDRFRDRLLFPIQDLTGQVVAFGGRILGDGQPKYMNSPESPVFNKGRLLFGLYRHREAIRRRRQAIVVEGNFDLLLLAVHGIDNVVAPLGTALTRDHIRLLRGYCDEVVLLFDGDSAGLKAAMRSVPFFLAEQVDARVALLPEGHDPDSLIRDKGAAEIEKLVAGSGPLAEFVFDTLARRYGLTLAGKNHIINELREIVQAGGDSAQRSLMVAHFSDKLGIAPAQFLAGVHEARPPERREEEAGPQRPFPESLSRKQRQLVDFMLLYPEFLEELLAAGGAEVVRETAGMEIISCLQELTATGPVTPDRLLSALPGESERRYTAELLINSGGSGGEEFEQEGRRLCDELLAWLHMARRRQDGADLMRQINEAQEDGDQDVLMRLLERKMAMGQT